jgi:hypothetical protein
MPDTTIRSHCIICSRPTNHVVLTQHVESERNEYARDLIYQIIQCAGCNHISFREICVDLENTYVDEFGKTCRPPETVHCYPKFIKNHKKIHDTDYFPPLVENVYQEVLLALQEDALLLAGMGLRVTVEAVCSDLGVKGKNLEQKINKLAAAGHISKKDALRLQDIRFMRSDSSQEILNPGKKDIDIALQIVEHLLVTVYVLPRKADGTIRQADQTENESDLSGDLLTRKLPDSKPEDEYPASPFPDSDAEKAHEQYLIWRMSLRRR